MSRHEYEIEPGVIFRRVGGKTGAVTIAIGLTFYIWDKKEAAVFCTYLSDMSEKQKDLSIDAMGRVDANHRVGIAKSARDLILSDERDLDVLEKGTTGWLSIAAVKDSTSDFAATLALDTGNGPIRLQFKILSSVDSIGSEFLNTSGTIIGTKKKLKKKHRPKIEKHKAPE